LGSNLLGQLEKIHPALAGHAHVGNYNVENLRFQLALSRGNVMRHLHAMGFLAEGDLHQLADGGLVVHDQDMCGVLTGSLSGCFCRLHDHQAILGSSIINSAPRSFSETTLMRPLCACTIWYTMESPNPVPPSKFDCSGSKILARCLRSKPTPVSRNAIRNQNGRSSSPTVKVPPSGMARSALSQRFQNTCLSLLESTRARSSWPLNERTI